MEDDTTKSKPKSETSKKDGTETPNMTPIEKEAAKFHITLWQQATLSCALLFIVGIAGYAILLRYNPNAIPTLAGRGGGNSIPALNLTLAFTNLDAAAQTTAQGQDTHDLFAHNGKIYLGYGDLNANTGPVKISGFDPKTGIQTLEYTCGTEEVDTFHTIGNKLSIPAADPGLGNAGWCGQDQSSGTWQQIDAGPFAHTFDSATLDGKTTWLCGGGWGNSGDDALAIYSPDGKTLDSLSAPTTLQLPSTATSAGQNRFYFCGALNGKLYTQSRYYPTAWVFDPSVGTWKDLGKSLFPPNSGFYGADSVELNGKMMYHSGLKGWTWGTLMIFDGTEAKRMPSPFNSGVSKVQKGEDGCVYAMGAGNATGRNYGIAKTCDGTTWTWVGVFSYTSKKLPYAFTILSGRVYIGFPKGVVKSAPLPSVLPLAQPIN